MLDLKLIMPSNSYSYFRYVTDLLLNAMVNNENLENIEARLYTELNASIRCQFIPVLDGQAHLWTVTVCKNEADADYFARPPMVLLHGFGSGSVMWLKNFEALSEKRVVYSLDLLGKGFGRSSRVQFSRDSIAAENMWIKSIEDWRRFMKLNNFYLLGHALGGYLAAAYVLQYPIYVNHLLLVDPWGFAEKPDEQESSNSIPTWINSITGFFNSCNPLSLIRLVGPAAPSLIRTLRPDIGTKYFEHEKMQRLLYHYLYLINMPEPTGESAFRAISVPFGWAKRPMVKRLPLMSRNIPITFIHGSRSWVDQKPGITIQKLLSNKTSVRVEIVRAAGHHVYADQPCAFNELVQSCVE
ncbi:Abhydrolase domain-containing protein 4 [Trichinella pseudospiralis]|uniref:Abhydrolase domain-containing protein 4 n=1 Tax=Trichinella pseudospiralis TaxID=6337 RepID=A0A0V1FY02_TRIPS|nr:Abhydrolase domain-containing protein 4 [Trichinella pseudospiralis]